MTRRQWGARAPQSLEATPFRRIVDVPTDEDCLTLNVFTPALRSGTEPALDGAASRPVMVWIHGGAFNIGSGCLFDAAELSRRGNVVVVTVNYRLGALGFSYLDHFDDRFAGSGNVALLDQIAALEWVRDNVAVFGGDANNVTIFGESAGGHSVGCLLTAPEARGLFHRAIAQSGAGFNLREVDQAVAQTTALMDQLGVTSVEALQAVPVDRLIEAQAAFSFSPVQDGVVLDDHVIDAVAVGNCADVPLLISHTRDEMRLFAADGRALGEMPSTDDDLADRLGHAFADGVAAAAAYRAAEADASPADLWLSYLTDARFHMPDFGLGRGTAHAKPGGVDGAVLVAVSRSRRPTRRLPRDRDPVPVHRRRQPRWDDVRRRSTRTTLARDPGRLGGIRPQRATPTRARSPSGPATASSTAW